MTTKTLYDDPTKDFRQRYQLPDQFVWHPYDLARIDFDGYMRIVSDLLPHEPLNIIDVGCGPGAGSQLLAERGHTVTGIDYNERGITFARLLVPECQFEYVDIRLLAQTPHLHNRFDAAVCVEVIEHIPPEYHDDVLAGIYKALKPDGILLMTFPSTNMPLNRWHYQHFTEADVVMMMRRNGFSINEMVYQHLLGWATSRRLHRLLSNQYIDLRIARRFVRSVFMRWFNVTQYKDWAGRMVVRAERG